MPLGIVVVARHDPTPSAPYPSASLSTHYLFGDPIPWPALTTPRGHGVLREDVCLIKMLGRFTRAVCATYSLLGCPSHPFNMSSH